MQRLFVYGSLQPGGTNAHMLSDLDGTWQAASIRGDLNPEGWGAALGYPGLVLRDDGEEVRGQLFSSDELVAHWGRLDEFEGIEYRRTETPVLLADGGSVRAWVYVLRRAPN
jgi:gamma-glutamylcyclotransferase (GGCT)/AIG2-like uncharacterized protein YtfP